MPNVRSHSRQRGNVLVEFGFGVFIFFLVLMVVTEFCHALWDYSTMVESARRGARYAVTHSGDNDSNAPEVVAIKNAVVYASPTATGQPALRGLTPAHVSVTYRNLNGTMPVNLLNSDVVVTVSISGYTFHPWFSPTTGLIQGFAMPMPTIRARLVMESQGQNF